MTDDLRTIIKISGPAVEAYLQCQNYMVIGAAELMEVIGHMIHDQAEAEEMTGEAVPLSFSVTEMLVSEQAYEQVVHDMKTPGDAP